LELARKGCGLVLSGRDTVRLETVAQEALNEGAALTKILAADLAAERGAEDLADLVEASGLSVDALVNNAGAGRSGPWSDSTLADDRAFFRLLIDAPLTLTRTFLPGWRRRGRGALLNICSTGAFQPGPQTAVYYAAKAFLASWSLAFAQEEHRWLAVTTVCPGAMKTGFSSTAGKSDVPGAPFPEMVAKKAIRAWERGRGFFVPGFMNKILVFVSRMLPPAWMARAVQTLQLAVKNR